ncbi:MAG: MarR family transcriptional regulator [Dehalococcoidia bacterium]|nr:MarR family transcriptional regulator [Dehalococcoidia bacterium]
MYQSRDELLKELIDRLHVVMRGIHTFHRFRLAGFIMRPPQVHILFYISGKPQGVSVKDLAGTLGVTPGAVSQFVDALVEKGLLNREEDPDDRRLLRIKLTEFAAGKFREFRKDYFATVSRVFDLLSDEELQQLTELLMKANVLSDSKETNR